MTTPTDTNDHVGAAQPEILARRAATRLRNLLRLNSVFSTVTGAVGLIVAGPIAAFLGVDQIWLVRLLGAGLLGFAAATFAVSGTRTSVLRRWSQVISLNDLGWVAGTVIVIAAGWFSTQGATAMGLIGIIVLVLGVSQMRAQRRLTAAAAGTAADLNEFPPVEILQVSTASANTAEQLWPIMTDHDLYARLALNLKAAEGLSPNGPGFERTCTDTIGRTWSETCTLWDPGRRFDVNVDISNYPYPLQLVQGSWQVEPAAPSGSTIGMTFAIQPEPGPYGRVFVPAMHLSFKPILRRITKGWQRRQPGVNGHCDRLTLGRNGRYRSQVARPASPRTKATESSSGRRPITTRVDAPSTRSTIRGSPRSSSSRPGIASWLSSSAASRPEIGWTASSTRSDRPMTATTRCASVVCEPIVDSATG